MKNVSLWTASHSASQVVEEYRNCSVEKATSDAERADSAWPSGSAPRSKDGTWRLEAREPG